MSRFVTCPVSSHLLTQNVTEPENVGFMSSKQRLLGILLISLAALAVAIGLLSPAGDRTQKHEVSLERQTNSPSPSRENIVRAPGKKSDKVGGQENETPSTKSNSLSELQSE